MTLTPCYLTTLFSGNFEYLSKEDNMEKHPVQIKSIGFINHDVLHIETEKPVNYKYTPGQATHMRIDRDGIRDEKGAFTFTNLPEEKHLEFTIKTYPSHDGMTDKLRTLKAGDTLILEEVYGVIEYKGEGVFIAGGAGITPFISIFKMLAQEKRIGGNKLIFANKRKEDIILKDTFEPILGENFINILSDEKTDEYAKGKVDEAFLQQQVNDFSKYFYVCGPPKMIDAVEKSLKELGATESQIIKENLG